MTRSLLGAEPARFIRPTRRRPFDALDQDAAAYFDGDRTRVARVDILGGVRVRASGPIERKRLPLCTELVVYLATHDKGVDGPAELDLALWRDHVVQPSTRTEAIARARRWLGVDRRGQLNLPPGHGREFRLGPGVLLDWDLFRRLAQRGVAAGKQGAHDLATALRLVRGKPFEGVPSTRYHWVADTFLEQDIPAAVVDVAHRLARSRLDAGDPVGARDAARVAHLVDRYDERPWRDLRKAESLLGNGSRVRSVVDQLMRALEVEGADELDEETGQLIDQLMSKQVRARSRCESHWRNGAATARAG